MSALRKNVASQVLTFCLVNASTGAALTGATCAGKVSGDGTQASASGTFTELGSGQYKYVPTQTETNVASFGLLVTATSAIPLNLHCFTIGYDPTLANVPSNVTQINSVSTSSVTTISANIGTTQPVNFTGTGASALAKSDMVDIAGAAVSTSSAQIGVNAVNIGGTAQTGRDIGANVLISSGTGTGQLDVTSGVIKANLAQILGTALTETAGQIAAGFKKFFNIASPTSTMNEITLVDTTTTVTNGVTVTTNNDKTGYTASTVSDKTGYSLSSGGIDAIWDEATSTGFTTGSMGALIHDNLDTTVSSRLASSSYSAAPTAASIADAVWEESTGAHSTSGTMGVALENASSAGDPWATSLPGSYTSGQAGFIVGTNVDAKVSTRLPTSSYTAPDSAATIATTVWDEATSSLTVTGSIGLLLATDIDATISSRSVPGDVMKVSSGTGANQISLSSGEVTVSTNNDKTGYTASTVSDKTGYALTAAYDPAKTAAQAGDAMTLSGDLTATMKTSVTTAATAATPTAAAVTGNVGGNVAGSVGSVTSGVTVSTNNDKTGYSLTQAFPMNFSAMSIDTSGNVSIAGNLKKNTAKSGFMFVMTDSTNHNPATGLTITATRAIDKAAFAACTNAVSEVGNGTYGIDLSALDMNGDHIMLRFTATGADDLNIEIVTQP